METLQIVGTVVGILVGLGTIFGGVRIASRWVRSWTFVKREELDRLKKIEPKYKDCVAGFQTLTEICAPYLEQKRFELVKNQLAARGESLHG